MNIPSWSKSIVDRAKEEGLYLVKIQINGQHVPLDKVVQGDVGAATVASEENAAKLLALLMEILRATNAKAPTEPEETGPVEP